MMDNIPVNMTCQLDTDHTLQLTKHTFSEMGLSPEQCIAMKQTYARQLWCTFTLQNTQTGTSVTSSPRLLACIPAVTPSGDFIWSSGGDSGIKANRYVLTMQLTKTPGIYYSIRKRRLIETHYCIIRTVSGGGILLTLEITPTNEVVSNTLRLLGDREKKTLQAEQFWEKLKQPLDLSLYGKRQIAWATQNTIKGLELNNPLLTKEEFLAIKALFDRNAIAVTDDRSLVTRRVLRYEDYLPGLVKKGLAHLEKAIQERWEWIQTDEDAAASIIDKLIGYRPLQHVFDSFFSNNVLFQLLDTTNPLSELSQKRRVTFRGPGGYPEKALLLDKRDVHPTDFGRLCPIETPQGQELGFSLYLAKDTQIDDNGLLCAKYLNKKTGAAEWINALDEITRNLVINDGQSGEAQMVQARTGDGAELVEIASGALTHQMPYPHAHIGYAASLIPFLQHNDGNRALMGANMMKQALPLLHKQAPLIITGLENDIAALYGKKSPFIIDNQLRLGTNLLAGYLPWDFYTYEDAIAISDSLVRSEKLTHVETEEIFFEAGSKEIITSDNEYLDESFREMKGLVGVPSGLHNLIRDPENAFDGVIKPGTEFKAGDILVSKLRGVEAQSVARDDLIAAKLLKKLAETSGDLPRSAGKRKTVSAKDIGTSVFDQMEDASLYAGEGASGKVVKIEWVDGVKERRRLKILIESRHSVRVGDKLTGRYGNKGVISRIIPEEEMPFFYSSEQGCSNSQCSVGKPHTHLELIINPLTITSRLNLGQLYETSSSWLAESQEGGALVAPPFGLEWSWGKIREQLDAKQIPVKRKLFFVENDQVLPIGVDDFAKQGVTVGYQYILKLKHLAEKKNKARNQSALSPSTGQPITPALFNKKDIAAVWENRKARKQSPQRLGEMEVWALQGHGAWHLLDELLFLKSDSNHLKQRMIDIIQELNRARKDAFYLFKDRAAQKNWGVQAEDDYLVVICSDQYDALPDTANECGLKLEALHGGRFKLTYAPLEITHRAHQSLKTFVLYCRGLGFEVEGVDEKDNKITMVGCPICTLPRLKALTIRIADDGERKKWSSRAITSFRGDSKQGLWPDAWDDPKKRDEATACIYHESCDYIDLPIPIDNPLFRPHLRALLTFQGCKVDRAFMKAFQELLTTQLPSFSSYTSAQWRDFWDTALAQRSRLLMREDVIAWLKELTSDTPEEILGKWLNESGIKWSYEFRNALPRLTADHSYECFPSCVDDTDKTFNVDDYSPALHIRDLYRHFELMDLKLLLKRIEARFEEGKRHPAYELIHTMQRSGYSPKDFFFARLTVLPRNLRYEHRSPRRKSFRSSVYNYIFNNDLNYIYQHILSTIERIHTAKGISRIQADIEEKRLRPLVYALLSNRPEVMTPVRRAGGRPLQGMIDILAGATTSKDGFFRQNLLGKRLDFSGRAVIIPGPGLGIDEASIPISMGLILFRDLLIHRCLKDSAISPHTQPILDENGNDTGRFRKIPFTVRVATAKVFLNKAENREKIKVWLYEVATDHLILLNRAPSLHRLSILSFHIQFHDGDDCIHLNPFVCTPFNADFDGDTMAIHVPFLPEAIADTQKMLPSRALRSPGNGRLCIDHKKDHALASFFHGEGGADQVYARLNEAALAGTEKLQELALRQSQAARNILKRCGFSLGIDDFNLDRTSLLQAVEEARRNTPSDERHIAPYWCGIANKTGELIKEQLPMDSPLKVLNDSGAVKADLQQLSAMRGIMKRPGGNMIPWPIFNSIVSGMTPLEYYVSCHGSRNGLADKGLLTAPAGDITNTMVQAAQGITIIGSDCGATHGLWFEVAVERKGMRRGADRFVGRFVAAAVTLSDGTVLNAGDEITKQHVQLIDNSLKNIMLRSPVTCKASEVTGYKGICQKCYGRELFKGVLPEIGYSAGIIASQSIGEPGTQLTLSSFHGGGAAETEDNFGIMDVREQFIRLNLDVGRTFREASKKSGGDTEAAKALAAEQQLELLQRMYSHHDIADHHFEVLISTMFVGGMIRSILKAATNGDGFLSRLAFKNVRGQLVNAVLEQQSDPLSDSKGKVMIGQII